jgi:hypothetical protein
LKAKFGIIFGIIALGGFNIAYGFVDGNNNGKDDRIENQFENPWNNESGNMMCAFMGYGSNESERNQCKSDITQCLNHNGSYDACTSDKYNQTFFN